MNALRRSFKGALLLGVLFQAAALAAKSYTVVKGDSLWRIAARADVLGDPWQWPLLLEANGVLIHDPDLIEPGWHLAVPVAPSAAQIAQARRFAERYQEPLTEGEEVLPAVTDLPAVELGPDEAAVARPVGRWRWGVLALLSGLLAAYTLRHFRRMRAALPRPASAAAPPPPQPTESEAILRAEAGPDPLHHDNHGLPKAA